MKNHLRIFLICLTGFASMAQSQKSTKMDAEQREAFIQKAIQLRQVENYGGAIVQLDSILLLNANDPQILLFKGDLLLQSQKYADAVTTYELLLPIDFEKTIVQINLSYALFMNHKPVKALDFAYQAYAQDQSNKNAVVNYFNALLWNVKTKQAAVFLEEHKTTLEPATFLVLNARLHTSSGDYQKGLALYENLAKSYANKHYVKEYSEVLLGKKEFKDAEQMMSSNQKLFSEGEMNAFQQKLKASQLQNVKTEFGFFKDVANNVRIENSLAWQQREGTKYRLGLALGHTALSSQQNEQTNVQFVRVGVSERWSKAFSGESEIHFQAINPTSGNRFSGLTGKQYIQYQPNDRRMIGLSYSSDILNFTASLLEKNIRVNNLGYVFHYMFDGKTGLYSQGSRGLISDKNKRSQFFASFYHVFSATPLLKGGLNYSSLHFQDNIERQYFAPDKYSNIEVFADFNTTMPFYTKLALQSQLAAGMQKIEQMSWDPALRMQAELIHSGKHFDTALKFQSSNVASNTGTGYKFNWFTLRAVWKW